MRLSGNLDCFQVREQRRRRYFTYLRELSAKTTTDWQKKLNKKLFKKSESDYFIIIKIIIYTDITL